MLGSSPNNNKKAYYRAHYFSGYGDKKQAFCSSAPCFLRSGVPQYIHPMYDITQESEVPI